MLDIKDCHILIVDDLQFNRQMIEDMLRNDNYNHISTAEDGQDALDHIEKEKPDLIILDLMMPKIDGYGVCRFLRNNPLYSSIPILVQTASSGTQEKNRAFEAGATDFITKPINPVELKSRVLVHLKNLVLTQELQTYHNRMRLELDAAKIIQTSMIPQESDLVEKNNKHQVSLSSFFKGSSELSGDIWGFLNESSQGLGYFIGDFTGHGVSAAVNTFRLHTILRELDHGQTLDQFVFELNNRLCNILSLGQYATFFCSRYDFQKEELNYIATGCPAPLIKYTDGTVLVGKNQGIPLGIMKNRTYEIRTVPFGKNDLLFTYSDALYDAISVDEEDVETIVDILKQFKHPEHLIASLTQGVNNRVLSDDLTLVALRPSA